MKSAYFLVSASALLAASAFYASHDATLAQPTRQGDAASCIALSGKTIAPNTVIESAQWRPDGDTVGGTRVIPPFCPAPEGKFPLQPM
jgi:hypothetical protein